MRPIGRLALIGLLLALVAIGLAPATPAAADDDPTCNVCPVAPPTPSPEGFETGVRSQVNQVNNGGAESGGPPPCSEEDLVVDPDDDDIAQQRGHFEYVPPLNPQDVLRNITQNTAPGSYWRLVCRFEDGFVPSDDLVDVDFFSLINPQNLARLAVAEALTRVPAVEVGMNPGGDQLVNLLTWLWVEGGSTETIVAPPLSVPGITVNVTVSTGGVYWRMGDDAEFFCPGNGTPYGAAAVPSCSHTYRQSSAGQPDERFHGSATVTWRAQYTVNGQGPYQVDDAVVRQTPFSVRVLEGQAVVVTGSGG